MLFLHGMELWHCKYSICHCQIMHNYIIKKCLLWTSNHLWYLVSWLCSGNILTFLNTQWKIEFETMQTRQTSFRTCIRIAHLMKWQIATGANAGLVGNVCKAGLSQKLICLLFCSGSSGHLQWPAGGCWPVRSAVWRKCSEWCRRCRTVLVSPLMLMIIHCYIYNLLFFIH